MRRCFSLILVSLFPLAALADTIKEPPVPNYDIVAPDASLSKELQAFSGVWRGRWVTDGYRGQEIESLLIVEKVGADQATIIYSWGGNFNIKPGHARREAKVSSQGNNPTISWSNGNPQITFSFTLKGEKVIGSRVASSSGTNSRIEMTRVSK